MGRRGREMELAAAVPINVASFVGVRSNVPPGAYATSPKFQRFQDPGSPSSRQKRGMESIVSNGSWYVKPAKMPEPITPIRTFKEVHGYTDTQRYSAAPPGATRSYNVGRTGCRRSTSWAFG
jgi:hypothetical protein